MSLVAHLAPENRQHYLDEPETDFNRCLYFLDLIWQPQIWQPRIKRVLEIGPGTGLIMRFLKERGSIVKALDKEDVFYKAIRTLLDVEEDVIYEPVEKMKALNFPDQSFDMVIGVGMAFLQTYSIDEFQFAMNEFARVSAVDRCFIFLPHPKLAASYNGSASVSHTEGKGSIPLVATDFASIV